MENQLVTDSKCLVGFTNGHHNDRGGYWQQAYGVSDKDQGFASTVNAGERTRDILGAIYGATVATEKNGAANSLATEKVGAAGLIETVRSTQLLQVQNERLRQDASAEFQRFQIANTLAMSDNRLEQQKQACELERKLAECCCKLEEKIAGVTATILSVDAQRIRDDLAEARAELLALRAVAV